MGGFGLGNSEKGTRGGSESNSDNGGVVFRREEHSNVVAVKEQSSGTETAGSANILPENKKHRAHTGRRKFGLPDNLVEIQAKQFRDLLIKTQALQTELSGPKRGDDVYTHLMDKDVHNEVGDLFGGHGTKRNHLSTILKERLED